MPRIHSTALIDSGSRIGSDVRIGPGAIIESDTEIGPGSEIGPYAVIHRYSSLGPSCRVHAHAVLGGTPQDLAFEDVTSYFEAGGNCVFREHVTVHRGTKEGTTTRIGNSCYLMAGSHLGHNGQLGNEVILANGAQLGGYVEAGDNVFFGGTAAIHQFVKIGRLTMVGGHSLISKDVPPFCMTKPGAYNRLIGLNSVGLRRVGFTPEERSQIKRAYKTLFHSGLNVTAAKARLRQEFLEGPAAEFARFIDDSERGICSGRPA